jgi:hypothetical protein
MPELHFHRIGFIPRFIMKRWMRVVALVGLAVLVWSRVIAQTALPSDLPQFLLNLRVDLELLADRVLIGERPATWTGNTDISSPSIVADIWFDNEQLADAIFGVGERPDDWVGATSPNPSIVARNVRHDLELASDNYLGRELRPDGWIGAPRVHRCSRTIMNLAYVLETAYSTQLTTFETVADYCRAVTAEINNVLRGLDLRQVDETQVPALNLAVRGDLERLADEKLGLGSRPPEWTNNKDVNSPTLATDNFADMERLADALLGSTQRPDGWNTNLGDDLAANYQLSRSNLELLADAAMGPGARPRGWQGEDPLLRCDLTTQYLVLIAQSAFGLTITEELAASPDFCALAALNANNIIENPPVEEGGGGGETAEDLRFRGESNYAFSYLDAAATQYMGVMPGATEFRAWYRNFSGSSMMFVSGEDFALFIDRRWTTMTQEVFDRLPTLEGVRPLTFCDATWCNGPAPTPTPTGGGPLLEIVNAQTQVPTPAAGAAPPGGKQLVSWNHIRVNYILQNPQAGRAQVTLEICQDPSQITCEPVISVFNNATGIAVPVISQLNGLNVYELPYGYTTNIIIEGTTYVSNDIWLNDPTLIIASVTPNTSIITTTPSP